MERGLGLGCVTLHAALALVIIGLLLAQTLRPGKGLRDRASQASEEAA